MADEIRIPVAADTTPMERDISNAASRARVSIRADLDSRQLEAFSRPLGKITGQADEFTKSMDAANARVLAFGASVGVVNAITAGFRNLVTATIEVEKGLNAIKIIGDSTFKNLDGVSKGVFSLAKQLGVSFKDASDATLEFARQGKNLEDSLAASRAALALTRTTGLDAAESVKGLTAAVNAFNMDASGYIEIVNKMSAVDSKFAVNSKDLIEGISRSASVAQEAGVSFDQLTALITTLQEKTGRGGAVIGNALKTIFTRVQNPEILKDIRDLGIAVQDISGNFLPATTILQKLANEFNNLDSNVRKNLLLKVGGGFQIDKLAAALNDMADANGTFQQSLNVSTNNAGSALSKVAQMNQTIDAAFTNMSTSAKEFGSTIGRIAFADDFRKILENGASLFEGLNKAIGGGGEEGEGLTFGQSIAKGIVKGIGSVISGPGLFLFGGILLKLTADFAKFSVSGVQTLIGITSKSKEQEAIQRSIQTVLGGSVELQSKLFSLEGNKTAQAQVLLNTYIGVANQMERISSLSRNLSQPLYEGGVRLGSGSLQVKGAANGYVPNLAAAISNEKQQSPASSKIIVDHNFPMGGGQRGTMVYNSNETRIKNFGGSGGDAIIPNYPVSAAGGYVPNFAVKPGNYAGKLAKGGKGDLRLDAMQASVAGLTLAGERSKFESSKPLPIDDKLLKNYQGSPLFDKLSEYDRVALTNVPVGNVYRFRKGLKQDEDTIKADFVSKLNTVLRPSILSFIDAEVNSLGLKTGGGLKGNLENLKTDLIGTTTAGYILEEILKIPTLTNAEKIAQYAAQSEKAYFDIQNLDSDTAEAYGLPKKSFLYADVKLGEGELYDGITKKYLNQAVYEGGGTKLKNAGKGYIPNFATTAQIAKNYPRIQSQLKKSSEADGRLQENDLFDANFQPIEVRNRRKNETELQFEENIIKELYSSFILNKNLKYGGTSAVDGYRIAGNKVYALEVKAGSSKNYSQQDIVDKFLRIVPENYGQGNAFDSLLTKNLDNIKIVGKLLRPQNAAKGYIPNFANTSTASGGIMRYKPSYSRTTAEEAVASLDATKGTRLTGTNLGSPASGGKVNLNENNIIASILGNNTFFQKNTSQSDTEKNLLTFVNRLTSQGRIVKFGKESADFAFASGSYDVKPEEIISGNISGKFKNIDYNKLGKIFPRLWRAKGVGDTWDLVKAISTYNSLDEIGNFKFTEAGKKYKSYEIADKKKNLPSYTDALRNIAISSVKDYDKDLLGFNINIAGSADEATLKDYRVGGDTSYLSLFGSKGITGARNVGQSAARERSIITSLPQDIKSTFTKGGSSTYGSFAKWYDQNAATFNFKSKKQAQEELAQALKLKSISYDGASKRMVFNAANGYVPNFAGDALNSAIMREKMTTGLSGSMISVSQDSRAVNSQFNPSGLIVTNKIDEPNGAASVTGARMASAYRNAGRGFIPNFSEPIAFENVASNLNIDTSKLKSAIEENVTSTKENTKIQKELTDFQKKRLEAERKKTEQELKQFSTAPSTTTSRTVPNTPAENSNKSNISEEVKKTEKSFADIAAKTFLYTSAISFVTGALSSFGEEAQAVGQLLGGVAQSANAFIQGREITNQLTGGKGISSGIQAVRNLEGSSSLREKATAFVQGGGGFGKLAISAAGGALTGAVVLAELYKGIDAYWKYAENGPKKSAQTLASLAAIQEKYNLVLSGTQETISKSLSAIANAPTGATGAIAENLDPNGFLYSLLVNKETTKGTNQGQQLLSQFNLGAQGGGQEAAANMLSKIATLSSFNPEEKNPVKQMIAASTEQNRIMQQAIDETYKKGFEVTRDVMQGNLPVTRKFAVPEDQLTKEEKNNVKNLKEVNIATDEEKQAALFKLIEEFTKVLGPKSVDIEAQRTSALGKSTEYLRSQLDIYSQLTKTAIDFKTNSEYNLEIQKESLFSSIKEKEEASLRLQLLQKDREIRQQQLDVTNQLSNQKIDKFISTQPGGVSIEKFDQIKSGFTGITDLVKQGASVEDIAKKYQEVLQSAGITNKTILAEQNQLITEQLTKVNAIGESGKSQILITDANLQKIKEINFNYNSTKEKLESQITLQKQKLSLAREEKQIQMDINDIQFKKSILNLSPGQQELLSGRRQPDIDFQRAEEARKQKEEDARQNALNNIRSEVLKRQPNLNTDQMQELYSIKDVNTAKRRMAEALAYEQDQNTPANRENFLRENPTSSPIASAGVLFKDNVTDLIKKFEISFDDITKKAAANLGVQGVTVQTNEPQTIETTGNLQLKEAQIVTDARRREQIKEENAKKETENAQARKELVEKFLNDPRVQSAGFQGVTSNDFKKNIEQYEYAKLESAKRERQTYTFKGGMESAKQEMDDQVAKFQGTLGRQIPMDFRDAMKSAMMELSNPNSTEPLKNRLLGVALAFTQKIQDAFMTNAANKLTSGITGLFGGSGGMASGGPIMGGSGTKDDVPAMLMGGEYVITKSAAQKYGPAFLNALNKGTLKKFAAGGFAGDVQELDLKEYAANKDKYTDYSAIKKGSLSFNESGQVISDSSYTGTDENGLKQKALMEAQTKFYKQNEQMGKNGFYMPGQDGMGAIMGQQNLLSFATQQTAGTKFDNISSSSGAGSINIGAGSSNLSLFALRDQGNSMSQQYLQAKQKALDLYLGGANTARDKEVQDYENKKAYEEEKAKMEYEYNLAKRTAKRQMYQGIVRNIAISAATAALSYGANKLASTGGQAAQQAKIDSINKGIGNSDFSQGYDYNGQLYSSSNLASIDNTRLTFGEQALGYNGQGGFFRGSLSGGSNNLIANNNGLYSWENGGYNKVTSPNWNSVSYGSTPIKIGGNTYYQAARRAVGGFVAGNGMGDNVPTMLNGGEFVISKQATQNIGTQKLQQLNSMSSSSIGNEGLATELSSKFDELIEKLNAVGTINITVNSDEKGSKSEKEESNSDAQSKELARRIKDVVIGVLRDEKRLGGLLR